MKFRLYGLLHLQDNEYSAVNVFVKNFHQQTLLYIKNAINLSYSLSQQSGISFTLLTNRKDIVNSLCKSENQTLQVEEIEFTTKIPSGVRFYSAHYKIDAFRYLASLSEEYVGLCDLDMVCINKMPICFSNNISNSIPMYYDISDQVIPAYGHDVIIRDLESIHNIKSEGRWAGGEFISGTPDFFNTLSNQINEIFDNYIKSISMLHHVGDEAIVSAALELMRNKGVNISDAGSLGMIGRFWNANILHHQKPFEYYCKQCFLLHLPADKHFLSKMIGYKSTSLDGFKKKYLTYKLISKIMKIARKCMSLAIKGK